MKSRNIPVYIVKTKSIYQTGEKYKYAKPMTAFSSKKRKGCIFIYKILRVT